MILRRFTLPLLLLTAAAVLVPVRLSAQASRASEPFNICSAYRCSRPRVAALAPQGFAVAYTTTSQRSFNDQTYTCDLRFFTAAGEPGAGALIDAGSISSGRYAAAPDIAPDHRGGVAAAWYRMTDAMHGIVLQWFRPNGDSEPPVLAGTAGNGYCAAEPTVATSSTGWTAVAWEDHCDGAPAALSVRLFGPDRLPKSPVLRLLPRGSDPGRPRMSVAPSGRFKVVWTELVEGKRILRGQSVGKDGRFLGAPFEISEEGEPTAHLATADGRILAVWKSTGPDGELLWLRRYASSGLAVSPPIELSTVPGAWLIDLSADRSSNLVVIWGEAGEGVDGVGRLFNQGLVPQGDRFLIRPGGPGSYSISLSSTGHFLCAWTEPFYPVIYIGGEVWQARHDADACVRRGKRFLCDTANDGAPAESSLPLGAGNPQEIPFLADWDGDGRADPCLYSSGRFSCDTGHDGGADVNSPVIGKTGDKPLLGDLNGDGMADPCVRRGAAVLCDLARDGGSKDLRIVFGVASDQVLLGDPNGDGRDDPCLLRSGRLLCDTAHDGNLAELKLDLRPLNAQGPALFGDVNGDGRAEVCQFTGVRFVCGVYPAGGGLPTGRIEIAFGQPGDVPLLGDLDAF